MHTFHDVPGYPNLMVNKLGEVWDKLKERPATLLTNSKGYKGIFYTDEYGKKCGALAHRLVALAFLKQPEGYTIVNHKDGNPSNNVLSNLEWSTYRLNNIHAVEHGLKNDNIRCKIRNFYTKEVKHFASLKLAKEYMGLDIKTDNRHLYGKTYGYLIKDKYEFKYEYDNTPWFYENYPKKINTRYKFTIDDKVVYGLNNIRKFLGIKKNISVKAILKQNPNIKLEYKNPPPKCGNPKKEPIEIKGVREDGAVLYFTSIREAARMTKCDKRRIAELCDTGRTVSNMVTKRRWTFTKVNKPE